MMRVLFTRFPLESSFGGAEVQTLSLMEGLRDRGHDVAFLGSCPTLLKAATSYKLQATSLQIGPPPVTKRHAISFLWRKRRMRRMLTHAVGERLPDAVFMLSMTEKLLLTEPLSRLGVCVYWIEHDTVGRWLSKNPWLPMLRKASTYATTVTVSELSRGLYLDMGWEPDRVIAIPNGIDLHRFDGTSTMKRGDGFSVGCIARLTSDKGVDVLIDAVADIPEVRLSIIGAGREEAYLRKLLSERDIGDRISLRAKTEDLGAFYRSLDVCVLPSREHDPFGLVAAEAMSLGVPTIVTDACGIAGYVEHGKNAIVIPADDRAALKENLLLLLRNESERAMIGENGKRNAHARFGLETMIDQYGALLEAKK